MSFLRVILLGLTVAHWVAAQDQTLVSGASGTAVAKAAVARVLGCGIFPGDNGLLRKIGWVESKDGTDPNTYRPNYHGGIWQVDSIGFLDTKTHPSAVRNLHAGIKRCLGVDWRNLSWSELRKPLYSAMAARAKLYVTGAPASCNAPIPSSNTAQADYWKICYNSALGAGTPAHFLSSVAVMPN
ncbi:hypothetical protein BV898_10556 [Hypsibius exemplaris]|uniref:Uncharacterized protein n=1 Tax=Hypsibius exemplaris TaxID=2072580 RepID=A0A1W0WJD2_HYPEX|nr:hypothetical protein BV898_10556 [Hypsibius exemplaris]